MTRLNRGERSGDHGSAAKFHDVCLLIRGFSWVHGCSGDLMLIQEGTSIGGQRCQTALLQVHIRARRSSSAPLYIAGLDSQAT